MELVEVVGVLAHHQNAHLPLAEQAAQICKNISTSSEVIVAIAGATKGYPVADCYHGVCQDLFAVLFVLWRVQ